MSKIDDKQIVYINSKDRNSGTDDNFEFNIKLKPNNTFDRVTLLQVGIPKSYYSLQNGFNYFTLVELGVSTTITLTPGNYTRTSLSLTVKSKLNSLSPHSWVYNVVFANSQTSVDTGTYTFSVTSNTGQPSFIFDNITFMDEMLGFASGSTNTFVANTIESTQVCDLQPFSCIQIHSNAVSNKFAANLNTDILQSVFMNQGSASYSFVSWDCPDVDAFSHDLASSNISTATFYLTDEDNVAINLNSVNFQMVIMFWKKNETLQKLKDVIKLLVMSMPDEDK